MKFKLLINRDYFTIVKNFTKINPINLNISEYIEKKYNKNSIADYN